MDDKRIELISSYIAWDFENTGKTNNKTLGNIAKMFLKEYDKKTTKELEE